MPPTPPLKDPKGNIGPKFRKKSGFFEKSKSFKTPLKQGFGLKRTSESSPAYFFTPPGPSLEAKAPRNTSFRQNLSFYSSFCTFLAALFSPVWPFPIQKPYSGPPGIIPPYRNFTHIHFINMNPGRPHQGNFFS